MKKIPIVFIHFGNSYYLNISVRQAVYNNPGSEVILLGDETNMEFRKICQHIPYRDFSKALVEKLEKVYKHSSTNDYHIELFCIQRWFVLYEFMKRKGLSWTCTIDSDVMLYGKVDEFFDQNLRGSEYQAAFCIPEQDYNDFRWEASGHTAYISLNFLEKFCEFVVDTYEHNFHLVREKVDFHYNNKISGGICDMTFLYLFYHFQNNSVLNLLIRKAGKVYDHNINSGDNFYKEEYGKSESSKAFLFNKKTPLSFNKKGEQVFFLSIHFQGYSKKSIAKYYRGRLDKYIFKFRRDSLIRRARGKILAFFKLRKMPFCL